MNDGMYSVNDVFELLHDRGVENLVVMKPNDMWRISTNWTRNNESLLFYSIAQNSKKIIINNLNHVSLSELISSSNKFRSKILEAFPDRQNDLYKFSLVINLYDLNELIYFNVLNGIHKCDLKADYDVQMGSGALSFALNNLFGFETMEVNGRFIYNGELGLKRFTRLARLSSAANRMSAWPFLSLKSRILNFLKRKLSL